jgi:ribosomal-protein-alanine N-acetyltransferase
LARFLETDRLILRPWRDDDLAPFAEMNADPQVMEHFPAPLDREQSDRFVQRIRSHFAQRDYGLYALEHKNGPPFLGFVGLTVVDFEAEFAPGVEIGWRLSRASWGQGLASEAASECLRFAFEELRLPEVVSFTSPSNLRSQAVMQRIGMTHDTDGDFEHPRVAPGHPLRRHVLFRKRRPLPGATR